MKITQTHLEISRSTVNAIAAIVVVFLIILAVYTTVEASHRLNDNDARVLIIAGSIMGILTFATIAWAAFTLRRRF